MMLKNRTPILFMSAVIFYGVTATALFASNSKRPGQLDAPVEWFKPGEKKYGLDIKYARQQTDDGRLMLTASNCFWNQGIRAYHPTPVLNQTESAFIKYDYEYLDNWTNPTQQINWHIWCEQPGTVTAVINLEVSAAQVGSVIDATLDGQTVSLKTVECGQSQHYRQPKSLAFTITRKGRCTLTLQAASVASKQVGRFRSIELTGSAMVNASLLRARWRPAAIHGQIWSSKVNDAKIWVVQSKTAKGYSSYSPITTPFGYYGTSFDADGRTAASMNFSMWSYARGKTEPPMEQLSHLIAVGSPDATFGGFDHEGTGVKLRGTWQPLAAKPTVLTQALRLDPGEPYDTYYGYYLDPQTNRWKFFAAGRHWHKPGKGAKNLSRPGSFVEVPGPPNRQRSGDLRREGFIRGWVPDAGGKWHAMDTASKGQNQNANKTWALLEDGWYSKAMGGMEHFDHTQDKLLKLTSSKTERPLPEFLSESNVKDLYKVPAVFKVKTLAVTADKAELLIGIADIGEHSTATVYYGTKEALTFADRWESKSSPQKITAQKLTVTLSSLKPKTPYYYRVLVENDQGKMWSADTCKFTTK